MSEREALWQAVLDQPEEDAPRLVLADWLEENEEGPRAEFIRLQLELARLPARDPRRRALQARAAKLEADHRLGWDPELADLGKARSYRRGFVEQVTFRTGTDFVRAAARLFRVAPVQAVEIEVPWFRFVTWARCPHFARLRTLKLGRFARRKWDADALGRVLAPEGLAGLTELDVNENYHLGADWGRVLAAAAHLSRLKALRLAGNGLGDRGVRALTRATHLSGLTTLDLSGNEVSPAGMQDLASTVLFAGLTHLLLGEDEEFDMPNYLGPEGVRALTESPHLTQVRVLDIRENDIGDQGAALLAAWPRLAGLEKLDLSGNAVTADGVEALASSAYLAGLKALDLSFNPLTDRGLKALASSPHAAGLKRLALFACEAGGRSLRAILDSPHLAGLTELTVDQDEIEDQGLWQALEERFGEGLNPVE